jgi:ABC-type transporter Mla subunit MlaD
MSEIISQSSADSDKLIQSLETPLQSMGIAFITSLIGLACSSIVTVVNIMFNTGVARNKLLATLEDYLDNILSPEVSGDSRLDKAVNRMVDQQHEFLQRFHENVTRAVQSSLGAVAKQIAEGNKEASELATRVYTKLDEVAGAIRAGADVYNQSSHLLKEEVAKISTIVQHDNFIGYSRSLENTARVFETASNTINNSQFGQKLITATDGLGNIQKELAATVAEVMNLIQSINMAIDTVNDSSNKIVDFGQDIKNLSENSLQILNVDTEHLGKIRKEIANTLEKQNSTYLMWQDVLEKTFKNSDIQTIEIQQIKQLIAESQIKSTAILEKLNNMITQESSKVNHNTRSISEDLQKAVVAMRAIKSSISQQITSNLGNTYKNISPGNRLSK